MLSSGPPVQGRVKWYSRDKGFGFVQIDGSKDAFLPSRALQPTGYDALPDGAELTVRIADGQKGPQVTEIVSVDLSNAQPTRPESPRRGPSSAPAGPPVQGTVKWFNAEKGFGFISPDTGGKDVFVHVSTLTRSGLSGLMEGQRVQVGITTGAKGPEAVSVSLLNR